MEGKPSISEMATDTDSDVTKLKGTKILVLVEDALIDVLVVSFNVGTKIYQGALLDITKKNAPYGIVPPAPEVPKDENGPTSTTADTTEEKVDKLYALKQRHTYYQVTPGATPFFFGYRFARNAKDKNVRMRRLRPRKVLCSQCQKVVAENDPNKKKFPGVVTRNSANKILQQGGAVNNSKSGANTGSVVNSNQRISTRSTKIDSSDKCDSASINTVSSSDTKNDCVHDSESKTGDLKLNRSEKMVLRKRKSTDIENTEPSCCAAPPEKLKRIDLVKSEEVDSGSVTTGGNNATSKQGLAKTSPVIKISFANPQGKESVLKIPARIKNASDTEEDSNWSLQENSDYSTKNFSSAKAAKKALKRAKKEAQKRAVTTANSPTTAVLSPSNENGDTHAADKEKHHHHKHKVKRKRKHKNGETETEKCDLENTDTRNVFNANGNDGWCLRTSFPGDIVSAELNKTSVFDEVKSKCYKKLSISLKRLNAKAYMRCSPKYSIEEDSVASDVSSASNNSVCSGSGSDYGDVPDFPKHSSPLRDNDKVKSLTMRIRTQSVKKCILDIGREMTVGDIVWGKIHGFPWWPGKVLALTVSQSYNGAPVNQQAHVTWFGSSTSSFMPCNQLTPFLDDFKIRFNKKKRGPYKEAIKQAISEAQKPHSDISELGLMPS
ncbi:PWWP domain-containing protein 2B [Parasteatoda tepidariorum]|uniref:PWWP domain-containing protein 2B n=1 Tax=Parasteatoda tepidariorum TaxID=114398 RepID=UPI00077FE221|nr:PWWP domain-containing protein 2B [Parasteatoda tepidariorum]